MSVGIIRKKTYVLLAEGPVYGYKSHTSMQIIADICHNIQFMVLGLK